MKKLLVISILVIAFVGISIAQQQPFQMTTSLSNNWRWAPATGNPDSYLVEVQRLGKWEVLSTVPATVEGDGFVHTTIVSEGPEVYRVRVTATDAAGNQGPPSDPSIWLLVFPSLPGRPSME